MRGASLRLRQCVQLHGPSLFMEPRKTGYISDFVCCKHSVCLLCVKGSQIPGDCTGSPDFFSINIEFFCTDSYMYQFIRTKQKASDNRFTVQSRIAGAQYGTCFIPSPLCLEFCGGL